MNYSIAFYAGWSIAALILAYQQKLVNSRYIEACFKAFSMNSWYGLVMWVALAIGGYEGHLAFV